MPLTPLGFAAVKSGLADGNIKPTAATPTASSGDKAKAILDVIKSTQKTEKEKAADTKGQTGGSTATSVSGNVIGVGQNPVVTAIHEQTELAKQSVEYLRMLATKTPNTPPANLTEKGGTPSTPATR